jgi:hypothetical protein
MKCMHNTCNATDYRHGTWIKPLLERTSIPVLQDTESADGWSKIGAAHDDILVYDARGKLFAYLCSNHSCSRQLPPRTELVSQDLLTVEGYASVLAVASLAAQATAARCAGYDSSSHKSGSGSDWWIDTSDWWSDPADSNSSSTDASWFNSTTVLNTIVADVDQTPYGRVILMGVLFTTLLACGSCIHRCKQKLKPGHSRFDDLEFEQSTEMTARGDDDDDDDMI